MDQVVEGLALCLVFQYGVPRAPALTWLFLMLSLPIMESVICFSSIVLLPVDVQFSVLIMAGMLIGEVAGIVNTVSWAYLYFGVYSFEFLLLGRNQIEGLGLVICLLFTCWSGEQVKFVERFIVSSVFVGVMYGLYKQGGIYYECFIMLYVLIGFLLVLKLLKKESYWMMAGVTVGVQSYCCRGLIIYVLKTEHVNILLT